MTTLDPECFLAHVSRFETCNIDSSLYPPPYVLHGRLPHSNFVCCTSVVDATSSWSFCHTFECTGGGNTAEPPMVLECYGNNGGEFVGMCAVQLSQLLEASSSGGSIVALQLRDGYFVRGEISFHATLEKLHSLDIHIPRMAIVPHSPPGASVYVELSCGYEGSDDAVSVTSERVATEVSEWVPLPPLLRCRVTPGTLTQDGVFGKLFSDSGERLGHFRIVVPNSVVRGITAPASPPEDGVSSNQFGFDVPVESTPSGFVQRCTGNMTLSMGVYPAVRQASAEVPFNAERSTETHETCRGALSEGLQVLSGVLEQQQQMLGTVREQLEWVRDYKATIKQRLEVLRRHSTATDSTGVGIRSRIERELQACIMQREQLRDELAALQERRAAATEEHLLRVEEQRRLQETLEEEQAKAQFLREGVKKLQLEMQAHAKIEKERERERLRQSEEQQQLNSEDAETLVEVMRLLERHK
ncbi:hypothetical protein MOQ_007832 [Trypanosoma cruzi marinkellei]|uniref:Uncharacterized protein n=1 Tax=Trypanosoma cruzi marinkellei TaxID=85056 RepID=K2M0D9_TRYCR|nr:hypothetical protein MOQ_007832 [Trypanosoma cruzi marinkellei]